MLLGQVYLGLLISGGAFGAVVRGAFLWEDFVRRHNAVQSR